MTERQCGQPKYQNKFNQRETVTFELFVIKTEEKDEKDEEKAKKEEKKN